MIITLENLDGFLYFLHCCKQEEMFVLMITNVGYCHLFMVYSVQKTAVTEKLCDIKYPLDFLNLILHNV